MENLMGNDMSWEQKCRISALRAACASVYPYAVPDAIHDEGELDNRLTTRILARAETFRNALLHNGRLDDVDSFIERVSGSTHHVFTEEYVGTCKHCLTAIQLLNPFNDETARWIDRNGWSQCHNKHEGKKHEPELEDESHRVDPEFPLIEVCPGCGSSSRKVRKLTESDFTNGLKNQYCSHEWHKS
jgi:hypothetical protein